VKSAVIGMRVIKPTALRLTNQRLTERLTVNTKKTGSFKGKSNKLGYGGRAAQLKAKGVPGGVIGEIARKKQAAPGQKNYHGKK
jgi:hypothetical protein